MRSGGCRPFISPRSSVTYRRRSASQPSPTSSWRRKEPAVASPSPAGPVSPDLPLGMLCPEWRIRCPRMDTRSIPTITKRGGDNAGAGNVRVMAIAPLGTLGLKERNHYEAGQDIKSTHRPSIQGNDEAGQASEILACSGHPYDFGASALFQREWRVYGTASLWTFQYHRAISQSSSRSSRCGITVGLS